jgi:hypothetical protein
LSDLQKNIDKGLEQLKDEVENNEVVDMSAAEMAKIRESFNIVDPIRWTSGGLKQIENSTDPPNGEGINITRKRRCATSKTSESSKPRKRSTPRHFSSGESTSIRQRFGKRPSRREPLRFMPLGIQLSAVSAMPSRASRASEENAFHTTRWTLVQMRAANRPRRGRRSANSARLLTQPVVTFLRDRSE